MRLDEDVGIEDNEKNLKDRKETHGVPDLVCVWLTHESSPLNLCATLYHLNKTYCS